MGIVFIISPLCGDQLINRGSHKIKKGIQHLFFQSKLDVLGLCSKNVQNMVKELITHSPSMRQLWVTHGGCDQILLNWSKEKRKVSKGLLASRSERCQKSQNQNISEIGAKRGG